MDSQAVQHWSSCSWAFFLVMDNSACTLEGPMDPLMATWCGCDVGRTKDASA